MWLVPTCTLLSIIGSFWPFRYGIVVDAIRHNSDNRVRVVIFVCREFSLQVSMIVSIV